MTATHADAHVAEAVLDRVAAELKKALRDPEVRRRYDGLDATNPRLFRADFERYVDAEAARWQRVVTARKINAE